MIMILQNLKSGGYVIVEKIKYDGGVYKADVIDAQGNDSTVTVDEAGKVTAPAKVTKITLMDAVKKAQAAGYNNIYYIEKEDHGFEIKAVGKDGKKMELEFNVSGNMTSKDSD